MDVKVSNVLVILITAALFVIVVAGMRAAASIINPFLLAVFLSSLCAPLLYWLQRRGVPNGLAVSAIILGLLVVALLLMIFVGRSLNTLAQQLPVYQERLTELIAQVFAWLNKLGLDMTKSPLTDYVTPRKVMSLVYYGLSLFRGLFTNMFLILLIVLFILLETAGFPRKLQAAFPDPEGTLGHFKTMTANVNRYMGFKALFSLATGVSLWILLALIGVEFRRDLGVAGIFFELYPGYRFIYRGNTGNYLGLGSAGSALRLVNFAGVSCREYHHWQPPGTKIYGAQIGIVPSGRDSFDDFLGLGFGPHRDGAFRASYHDWQNSPCYQ